MVSVSADWSMADADFEMQLLLLVIIFWTTRQMRKHSQDVSLCRKVVFLVCAAFWAVKCVVWSILGIVKLNQGFTGLLNGTDQALWTVGLLVNPFLALSILGWACFITHKHTEPVQPCNRTQFSLGGLAGALTAKFGVLFAIAHCFLGVSSGYDYSFENWQGLSRVFTAVYLTLFFVGEMIHLPHPKQNHSLDLSICVAQVLMGILTLTFGIVRAAKMNKFISADEPPTDDATVDSVATIFVGLFQMTFAACVFRNNAEFLDAEAALADANELEMAQMPQRADNDNITLDATTDPAGGAPARAKSAEIEKAIIGNLPDVKARRKTSRGFASACASAAFAGIAFVLSVVAFGLYEENNSKFN